MAMKYYRAYLAKESGVHLEEDEIWLWGDFIIQSDIEVDRPVRYILERKNLTQDFVDVRSAFLVSTKLFEVLSTLTDNYKTYPAVITKKDGTVIEDYRIFHIGDEIACFNWEKSIYVGKDEATGMPDYRTIVLDKKALGAHIDKHVFRMKEIKSAIIINDHAKEKLKEAKITGFAYEEFAVE